MATTAAILIDDSTAANRAVNIPEFVNVPADGLRQIGGPVIDYYRLFNSAAYLQRTGRYEESAAKWRKVLELSPDDEEAHRNLGTVLLMMGHRGESAAHSQKASEIKFRAATEADPASARACNDLGVLLLQTGRVEEAVGAIRESRRIASRISPPRAPTWAARWPSWAGWMRRRFNCARRWRRMPRTRRALQSGAGSEPAGGCRGRHSGMAPRALARP